MQTRIAPHYPAALVHMLSGKGHLLPVEASAEIARVVREFATSLQS